MSKLDLPETKEEITAWTLEYSGRSFFNEYIHASCPGFCDLETFEEVHSVMLEIKSELNSWVAKVSRKHNLRITYEKDFFITKIYLNGVHVCDS